MMCGLHSSFVQQRKKDLKKSNQAIVLVNAPSHSKVESRFHDEVNYGSLVLKPIELTLNMMKAYNKIKVFATTRSIFESISNMTMTDFYRQKMQQWVLENFEKVDQVYCGKALRKVTLHFEAVINFKDPCFGGTTS
eukprot:snap_masked-scaffold_1-processed-gene-19.46-mRNA-1 protein AED:1.00 eAED:1.00 QI:0/0/0/0/1/1/2/0/135